MGWSGVEQGGFSRWRLRALGTLFALLAVVCAVAVLPGLAHAAPAGKVSGHVASAPGGEPIAGSSVCAISELTFVESCVKTGESGEYAIEGLAYGSYDVLFTGEVCTPNSCEQPWVAQYWNGAGSVERATAVTVGSTSDPSEIDGRLTLGGKIEGVVTDTQGAGIEGLEVCAFELNAGDEDCTQSGPGGDYTLEGVPQGNLIVGFFGFVCNSTSCAAKYITQYYKDSPTPGGATTLPVAPGQVQSRVDATMAEGGRITGAVTEEGRPLEGVIVCALQSGEPAGCALTEAGGAYTIAGLASGQYVVGFEGDTCGSPLDTAPGCQTWTEYFPSSTTAQGATPVTVDAPATTAGINLEINPPVPQALSAPTLQGVPAVGQLLSCTGGEWAQGAKTITFEWLRDGTPIAGQTSNAYLVQSVDEGHQISCKVNAVNAGGTASAVSNAVQIPVAAKTTGQGNGTVGTGATGPTDTTGASAGTGRAKKGHALASHVASVRGGRAAVRLHCAGAGPCKGRIELLERASGHSSSHSKHHTHAVKIGSASFSLAQGAKHTLRVRLAASALKAIKAAGPQGLAVQVGGIDVRKKRVMLRVPAKS